MKKNDFILALIILVLAGVAIIGYQHFNKHPAQMICVTVDGKIYGTYSLQTDQEILIHKTNKLVIKDGKADMMQANCPDQTCVNQKPIQKSGESIICLPNRLSVIIKGEASDDDPEFVS